MAKIDIQNNYALKTPDVFICRWSIFFQSLFFLYSKTETLSLATSRRISKLQRIAIFCKERGKKSLILDSRSEAQWLTWFWWKLWAWMTSLKKEHGIREKAICFKTVIWSGFFFWLFCSSARAEFLLISKNAALSCELLVYPMICWSHSHMAALLTRSRQRAGHLKTTWKGALLQCVLSHSPRKVLFPRHPLQYITCSVSSSPKTPSKDQITLHSSWQGGLGLPPTFLKTHSPRATSQYSSGLTIGNTSYRKNTRTCRTGLV